MIELRNLNKTFHLKSGDVPAVQDVSLSIEDGEIYGIIGYSGAGKSTLVRCLNLLEVPDSGEMDIAGTKMVFKNGEVFGADGRRFSEKDKCALRRGIGMIFQHFNLLDRSTVFENVAYPLKFTGRNKKQIRDRVLELLELVGLTDKRDVYPSQLSGGQKQRVAIARALASDPKILLSDEATSALDPDATESILTLLKELNRKLGLTIVLITHEMAVIKTVCRRVAVMENGRVVEDGEVYGIFAHPTAAITRRFVSSASPLDKVNTLLAENHPLVTPKAGEKLVRLTFDRENVGEHLISDIAQQFGISLNIVLANVEMLEDSPLGGLIAILSGDNAKITEALTWLDAHHVQTEVLANGH